MTRHQLSSRPIGPRRGRTLVVRAARHAEVCVADPRPAVRGRVGEHVLQQVARGGLLVGLSAARRVDGRQPGGERVADALELGEREQPRARRRAHGGPGAIRG